MHTINDIMDDMLNIAISSIEWLNMPPEIDIRYLEETLCIKGQALFFQDEIAKKYVALNTTTGGRFSIYNIPLFRKAFVANGYNVNRNKKNSVLIFNNYTRTPIYDKLYDYAYRIYNAQRAADTNINAQKTPVLLVCTESEKLTMENLYKEYSGNAPVIKGYKGLDKDNFGVLKTDAPYIADKLLDYTDRIWNECLTFLGVVNSVEAKRERQSMEEIDILQGKVYANRIPRLAMRKQACEEINRMFGLNIDVRFRNPDIFGVLNRKDGTITETEETNE